VPEVEHYIWTVKERVHCTYNILPFKQMPVLLVIEIVLSSILWLNSFSPQAGRSIKDNEPTGHHGGQYP